jgi:menaquinone-9 beta-reductase
MENCEVLILGGGPAGATCARLLAQEGLSVLLVDREEFPRDKPCAGWVTPAVFQTLRIDPQLYRRGHLLQEITQFETGLMYGKELVTDYGHTVSYGIRRSEFDHFLLMQSGARTLLGETVAKIERLADGWLVNGWIKARLLIGAGGHHCPVARALGAVPGREPAIVAMVAEFEMSDEESRDCTLTPRSVKISFTRDLRGYGWLFRKGSYLNVGLGSLESRDIRKETARFCSDLRGRGELQREVAGLLKGHAYLPYRNSGGRRIVADGALVIGDAAGVCFPESGEGILPAVESGIMAAETVLAAAGDFRQEKLQGYADAIASRFMGCGGSVTTPAILRRVGGAAILSNRYLTRHLVLDRWFLHTAQQALNGQQVSPAYHPSPAGSAPPSG